MLSYNVKIFPHYQEKGLCVLMPWAHCMSPIMYVFIVNCYHYLKYFVVYNNNIIAGIWKLKKNLSVHQASWCCRTSSSNSVSAKIFTAIFIISLFVITFECCNIYSVPLQGPTLSLDPWTSFFIIREINGTETKEETVSWERVWIWTHFFIRSPDFCCFISVKCLYCAVGNECAHRFYFF